MTSATTSKMLAVKVKFWRRGLPAGEAFPTGIVEIAADEETGASRALVHFNAYADLAAAINRAIIRSGMRLDPHSHHDKVWTTLQRGKANPARRESAGLKMMKAASPIKRRS